MDNHQGKSLATVMVMLGIDRWYNELDERSLTAWDGIVIRYMNLQTRNPHAPKKLSSKAVDASLRRVNYSTQKILGRMVSMRYIDKPIPDLRRPRVGDDPSQFGEPS